ncbi:MAG TPA: hypothetical protein VJZ27_05555, partial [Aggregatilineales bacterium]|nr:hypothetical protein [Aggregatilineales bacterium]
MIENWLQRLSKEQQERVRQWGRVAAIVGSIVLFTTLGTLALAFDSLVTVRDTVQLQVGDVAPRDINAPRSLTYPSDVQTRQAQQDATGRVQPVYDPNPDVTREQIKLARAVTGYINEIRHDTYASLNQKVEDLLLIEVLTVSEDIWRDALNTS